MKVLNTKLGFTLVEIMIVVAIIVLLATFAIPGFLRARLQANESSAISSLRLISSACETFRAAQTPPTYPTLLTDLSDANPPYLDTVLSGGTKHGYTFEYEPNLPDQYTCTASPTAPGKSGIKIFVIDESGVVTGDGVPIQ